jgi:putative heme-binding domain-containing protein
MIIRSTYSAFRHPGFPILPRLLVLLLVACTPKEKTFEHPLAATEDVARYMENFEGRGDLTDPNSQPMNPEASLKAFQLPDDLHMELVLSEPDVVQPLHMSFDPQGRLWVVQYQQYPYPEGLKITSIDNHTRVKFDRVPEAPPAGAKGADVVAVFEDKNSDGNYTHAFNAIEGLNIASSVALGRDRIWVLNPPYLLAFPDPDGDGKPDAEPEIHLEGFGLEDTHSIANSLQWGPDGWLYGVQGSTTTANISFENGSDVAFQGQAIWRYQPDSKRFELFAEGGGNNPFYLEFDRKGRIFSGSNGYGRGPYYKQGGYYVKSWGKHGALTNPYAFGHLPNMPLDGENKRFTHAVMRYEAALLPAAYRDKIMALNPLHNFIQLTALEPRGSSFATRDIGKLVETADKWFRPVDIKTGPDGAVYLADWYDSRLSHVDPRDTWHKSSGRIYRIVPKSGLSASKPFNLAKADFPALTEWLTHPNKWFRQQALRQFADRNDPAALPGLHRLFASENYQHALEALWAIHLSDGFDEAFVLNALQHPDPAIRSWTYRLVGDQVSVENRVWEAMVEQAEKESVAEVSSQIASTARRLPAAQALPLLKALLRSDPDPADPDIPLLIWWAMEAKVEANLKEVLAFWEDRRIWENPLSKAHLAGRLMQRLVMAEAYPAATEFLKRSPDKSYDQVLVDGFYQGLLGRDLIHLPRSLIKLVSEKEPNSQGFELALRSGDFSNLDEAIDMLREEEQPLNVRLRLVHLLGELRPEPALPALLALIQSGSSPGSLKQEAIHAVKKFDDPEIGEKMAAIYPGIRADTYVREEAIRLFASRPDRAAAFFAAIRESKVIHKEDVPYSLARRFYMLEEESIPEMAEEIWPESKLLTAKEKTEAIASYKRQVRSGKGDALAGRQLFLQTCGSCHRLDTGGGNIGPDLTGYDRSDLDYWLLHTVDPHAGIREGFETVEIETHTGRKIWGKLEKDEGGTKYIRPPLGGKGESLPDSEIREMRILDLSIMPERLLEPLNEQQVRDLFAYILK